MKAQCTLFYYEKFKDLLNVLMITTKVCLDNYSANDEL